jgi:hypothetical protein
MATDPKLICDATFIDRWAIIARQCGCTVTQFIEGADRTERRLPGAIKALGGIVEDDGAKVVVEFRPAQDDGEFECLVGPTWSWLSDEAAPVDFADRQRQLLNRMVAEFCSQGATKVSG